MSTLHDSPAFGQDVSPFASPATRAEFEAWLDDVAGSGPEPAPEPTTDRAWLASEAENLTARFEASGARFGHAPVDALRLAAQSIRHVLDVMRGAGVEQVAGLFDAGTAYTRERLDAVRLPDVGTRRTRLAAALDILAAWYLHLDTDAGDVAAWEILYTAEGAEYYLAESLDEYLDSDAAFTMAAIDAMYEAE